MTQNQIKIKLYALANQIRSIRKVPKSEIIRITFSYDDKSAAEKVCKIIPSAIIKTKYITNRYAQTSEEYFVDIPQ